MGDGSKTSWLAALDRVLRGEATRPSALLREGALGIPIGGLAVVSVLLAIAYGACMGSFAISRDTGNGWPQVIASAIKVPALFGLTLAVTFPSRYVFNALVGSRLGPKTLLGLLVASISVTLAVLASLGPIVAFFSVVSTSYAFVKLMNVAAFAVSGGLGLGFLLQTLHRLSLVEGTRTPAPAAATPPPSPSPAPAEAAEMPAGFEPVEESIGVFDRPDERTLGKNVKLVFGCWVVLFALVGAQMSWVLRPFIGDPALPFTLFRSRQSNFFEDVLGALGALFQG
jgi:hypothetical protein